MKNSKSTSNYETFFNLLSGIIEDYYSKESAQKKGGRKNEEESIEKRH